MTSKTYTWTGAGGDHRMDNPENWNPKGVPKTTKEIDELPTDISDGYFSTVLTPNEIDNCLSTIMSSIRHYYHSKRMYNSIKATVKSYCQKGMLLGRLGIQYKDADTVEENLLRILSTLCDMVEQGK